MKKCTVVTVWPTGKQLQLLSTYSISVKFVNIFVKLAYNTLLLYKVLHY